MTELTEIDRQALRQVYVLASAALRVAHERLTSNRYSREMMLGALGLCILERIIDSDEEPTKD